jgi:hypothetical integral membrane protein (TIGR02206 family)
MTAAPFRLFGPDHLAALAAVGCAAVLAPLAIRRRPSGRAARGIRVGLAALLLLLAAVTTAGVSRERPLQVWDFLPLHLCDAAVFLAAFALLTRGRGAVELLYFWALGATSLAMITPDLSVGAPDWHFLSFFAIHGSVVISAAVLVFGFGLTPRPGAVFRAFLLTNSYAAVVAVVDFGFDQNFLYLRAKPEARTILDAFGPWPLYLLPCEILAAGAFRLLGAPFRDRR